MHKVSQHLKALENSRNRKNVTVQELELISCRLINTVSLGLLTGSQALLNGQFSSQPFLVFDKVKGRNWSEDNSNKAGIVSCGLDKDVST